MTNTKLLTEKIERSGLRKGFIAEKMGITRQTLWAKVRGDIPFNQFEIASLCEILGIKNTKEKEAIFFAH